MAEIKAIPYKENTVLEVGKKYISDCGIEFTYIEDKEKPYVLNNGISIDHIPTTKDKPTSNLKRMSNRDKEEIKRLGSLGGKRSQEVQRNRRTFKESMQMVLSIKASQDIINALPDEVKAYFKQEGIEPTYEDIISIKASLMAMDGSIQHAIFSRDTVGDKPIERQEVTADIITDADRELINKIGRRLNDNKQ